MSGTILIVTEQDAERTGWKELFHRGGSRVITVPDGQSALEEFTRHDPDLVLLGSLASDFDPVEVCRQFKIQPGGLLTPIVVLTQLPTVENRIRAIEAGADHFFSEPVDPRELHARVRSLLRVKAYTNDLERAEQVLLALARSIEGKDPYTEGHCQRLSEYSAELGRRLCLAEEFITALRRGGIAHDIGKVAVPDAILRKPGQLTDEEWILMREHPVVGERICAPLKSFQSVLPIIRHHHERFDGSGYPDGLEGELIPLTARILQLVDIFDALTTDRPYHAGLQPHEALRLMETEVAREWRDPRLFAEFHKMVLASACS